MERHAGACLLRPLPRAYGPPPPGGAIVLVETRPSFWLGPVLCRAAELHPAWPLYVFGTPNVVRQAVQAVRDRGLANEIRIGMLDAPPRISLEQYSRFLTSEALWDAIREPFVLTIQPDVALVRPVREEHVAFDMIGAACGDLSGDSFTINGGLSLRSTEAMRRACRSMTEGERALPEDAGFCSALRRLGGALPTVAQCHGFAIESFGNPATAIGVHGTDKYYAPPSLMAAMCAQPRRPLIDAFMYNGEPIVKLRLALLANMVQRFVIVEARYTHAGERKSALYKDLHADHFAPYADRIDWVILEEAPPMPAGWGEQKQRDWPWILDNHEAWWREMTQRDALKLAPAITGAPGDAIGVISDCDEIPDPAMLADLELDSDAFVRLDMPFFMYSFRWRKQAPWSRAVAVGIARLRRDSPTALRCGPCADIVPAAGWHASYFGTHDYLVRKIASFAHREHSAVTLEEIRERVRRGLDPVGRGGAEDGVDVSGGPEAWLDALSATLGCSQ